VKFEMGMMPVIKLVLLKHIRNKLILGTPDLEKFKKHRAGTTEGLQGLEPRLSHV
jgi:hypothetical protein